MAQPASGVVIVQPFVFPPANPPNDTARAVEEQQEAHRLLRAFAAAVRALEVAGNNVDEATR